MSSRNRLVRRLGGTTVVGTAVVVLFAVGACGSDDASTGDRADGSTSSVSESSDAPTTDTTFAFTLPGGGGGDFDETEVVLGSPPYEVPGTLRLPVDATAESPVPGALVVGDFGPHDEDGTVLGRKPLRDLGEGLAERGVATLTYEKRTFTYQDELAGAGSVGVMDETVDDAASGLARLRETEGVDPDRLYVVGHGYGGALGPRIAEAGGGAAGLIALAAPARPMQQVLVDEARYLAELDGVIDEEEQNRVALVENQAARIDDPALSPEVPPGDALGAAGLWWLDQRTYDTPTAVANSQVPTLVVLGGRDYRANQADQEAWRTATDLSGRVRLEVVDDLDHHLAPGEGPSSSDDYASAARVDPRVFQLILDFMESPPS